MKKYFYLFAVICSMAMFTACSSDDDDFTPDPTPGEVAPEILGQWNLVPVETEDDGWGGENIVGGPVVLDWQCDEGTMLNIPLSPEFNMPLNVSEQLAPMAENLANGFLPKLLQSVTFEADGTITAMYSEADDDMTDDNWTPEWKKAEGYAHWTPVTTRANLVKPLDLIMVYLDSDKILSTEDDAEDKAALSAILEMFKDGIPVHIRWNPDGKGAFFYVDKDYIAPMMNGLSDFASNLPTDGMDEDDLATVAILKGVLGQIPDIMSKTQKFEAGLQLVK